jgi:putative phosphoribosyl transferase
MNRSNAIVFSDRRDAGVQLGHFLLRRYKQANPIILGVPRGGMEVACYVAQVLEAPLDMVIAKKLPLPGNAEVAFGAIAEDLTVYVSPKYSKNLDPEKIGEVIDQQTDEVNRRVALYRNGKQFPDLNCRTVIIVDDGIATGATLVPVVQLCRKRGASEVIIAVPVCGNSYDVNLNRADKIEILVTPEWFYAVGQSYATFGDLTDDDLMAILRNLPEPKEVEQGESLSVSSNGLV